MLRAGRRAQLADARGPGQRGRAGQQRHRVHPRLTPVQHLGLQQARPRRILLQHAGAVPRKQGERIAFTSLQTTRCVAITHNALFILLYTTLYLMYYLCHVPWRFVYCFFSFSQLLVILIVILYNVLFTLMYFIFYVLFIIITYRGALCTRSFLFFFFIS